MAHPAIIVGASRPHPTETENGDAWSVRWSGSICRIFVIDGLGHGHGAAMVARLGLDAVSRTAMMEPAAVLRICHAALIGSRGAAGSVITIDTDSGLLSYAGVGNVEGRVWDGTGCRTFLTDRGILGYRVPSLLRTRQEVLDPKWLLCVHSDGIRQRSLPAARPTTKNVEPQTVVRDLLAASARDNDDATIVAAWLAG